MELAPWLPVWRHPVEAQEPPQEDNNGYKERPLMKEEVQRVLELSRQEEETKWLGYNEAIELS
jgi:hypothetical protein